MEETILFKHVATAWLEEKKEYIKISTYMYYRFEMETYILPQLGEEPLVEVNEKTVQQTVLFWQRQGGKGHAPLKKSTVQNLTMLVKQCLRHAVKEGYIQECSMRMQYIPTDVEKKQKVFSENEQTELVKAVLANPNSKTVGILLCLSSGLRIGEVCALRWEDIDFDNRMLHVTKTLQRIYKVDSVPHTEIVISSPKTRKSIRDVPLSDNMTDLLLKTSPQNKTGYLLTNEEHYVEPRTFRKFYMKFLETHQIKGLNFHCLRHTFATRCIENGGDYKSVSEILGHTTINTTLNMYVHPQEKEKRRCVELVRWE